MAVYERTYKRYVGRQTPQWSRFLVLPRYALSELPRSRLLVTCVILSFFYPLTLLARIYLLHNANFLELFEIDIVNISDLLAVDGELFKGFLVVQGWFALFLTLFIGPGLVSRDFAHNGLPLYLSRPFTRAEYVLGKLTILVGLLSAITWIPGLFLFLLHGNYEGIGWMVANARLAVGVVVGSWIWILILGLLALALSAWVRWRSVAAFVMMMIILAGVSFANIVDMLFNTEWGHLINLTQLVSIVWSALLGTRPPDGPPIVMVAAALLVFGGMCLFLLDRKIRAYEVVG